jgi:glucokinase
MQDLILGVEIGGTKLQVAAGTPEGDIIRTDRGASRPGAGAGDILEWFAREIPIFMSVCEDIGRFRAVGVGFGGPVETHTGRVLVSHQVAGWDGIHLKKWFQERFTLPTVVANDSNAAGWAEYCRGAGRGTRHFCYMNIGSGIGGALVIEGRLHDGQGFGAGEIGHTYVPDWTHAAPGAADKLENLCSGWSIERRVRARGDIRPESPLGRLCGGDAGGITCPMLGDAARAGDPVALEELRRVGESVGLALANVITLFHPQRLALGGGVSLLGEVLLDPIRESAARHVFGPYRNRYEILPCELGESVVLVGAILLAADLMPAA